MQSLQEMFVHGGPVMWPLLAASVLALAIILDRTIAMAWSWQSFDRVKSALEPLIRAGAWQQAEDWCQRRGPLTRFARAYLRHREEPESVREDLLRREGLLILGHLGTRLRWLAMLAQVGTLLGLLGTFYFMIWRFHPDRMAGGEAGQAEFFLAIWESFLSTMYGLLIAIPCTVAYHLFEARVDVVANQMNILLSYLDEWRRTPAVNSEEKADRTARAIASHARITA